MNAWCRQLGKDNVIVISIHANATGHGDRWYDATGWCAYTSKGNTKADSLANCLYEAAQASLPRKRLRTEYADGDPDIEENFYILRHITAPAVLTKNFFMDSHPDCAFLLSEAGQSAIINLHVTGILRYLDSH